MRPLFVVLIISVAALAQQSAPLEAAPAKQGLPAERSDARQVTIPAGTHVPVSLRNAISTKSSHVGDQVYAPPAEQGTSQAALKRQFLHACSLELRRYPDNSLCTFAAPLAGDLASWMKSYFPMGLGVIDASSTVPA